MSYWFYLTTSATVSLPVYRADSPFNTPNIDRVAAEGIRFTDAHACAASCTPTRYGLLTGRYPHRTGQFQRVEHVFSAYYSH